MQDGETRGEGIVKNIVGPVTVPMLKRLKAHYDYTLLMFTTPWCGYCNHLKLQVLPLICVGGVGGAWWCLWCLC